ncbi:hypothetical protein A3K63_01005 [Candidatus Micrarchaeota archaeon RBG_16_49_10]|nr:MAG: hypothetical protein A3K63_01005 [Candidatus Micrarchaeota archaeon RBG_16_49_10]
MEQAKVQVATKAIILKKGKFLAIKQSFGGKKYLDLPGGRIEYGLTPEENVVKEVKEEMSLNVKVQKILGIYHFFRGTDRVQVVCITYLCKPLSDVIDLTKNPDSQEKLTDAVWVTPKEFLALESDYYDGLDRLRSLVANLKIN